MTEMVERVARAICDAENGNPGVNGCRECSLAYTMGAQNERRNCVENYGQTARAAIEAMMPPDGFVHGWRGDCGDYLIFRTTPPSPTSEPAHVSRFKPGALVQLSGGGPTMTLDDYQRADGKLWAWWFRDGELVKEAFAPEMLSAALTPSPEPSHD